MTSLSTIERLRRLLMFVIAWLIGLYVYEVVRESSVVGGLILAAATLAVNLYARKRAAAHVTPNRAFYFWLYLPAILFFALPVIVKTFLYFTREPTRSWWTYILSLLPFLLKLGVPVLILLWVYFALGKLPHRPSNGPPPDSETEA